MVSSVNLLEASETESNPQLVKLLDEVDRLLEGPADEKQLAYSMLLEHEDEVNISAGMVFIIQMTVLFKKYMLHRFRTPFILLKTPREGLFIGMSREH